MSAYQLHDNVLYSRPVHPVFTTGTCHGDQTGTRSPIMRISSGVSSAEVLAIV